MRRLLFLLVLLTVPLWADAAREKKLQQQLNTLSSAYKAGTPAVSVFHLGSQERAEIRGDKAFPLASVFKVPIMVELARQMQEKSLALQLDSPLYIGKSDKCIGSGSLQHQPDGTGVSVRRLIELMETRSDNTATDMLFRRIGLESVDRMMRAQGCPSSQIYLTNRGAWLISLAQSSDFKGLSPNAIAAKWGSLKPEQRLAAIQRAEKENQSLSLSRFQQLEDQSANTNTSAENIVVATTVDNLCSARDLSLLLAKLHRGELLDPQWTSYCLGVLGRQAFNTRLPRHLPRGVKVYHKTGTIAGVVNDVGLIEISPGNVVAVSVLVQQVPEGQEGRAEAFIAEVARIAYRTYK